LETAGTLLSLFVMILIVGYRRRRIFERVLFFLTLALFLYYSGILLVENASLYYSGGIPPAGTSFLAELLVSIALIALPGLLVHTCFAYGWAQVAMPPRRWQIATIVANYLPGLYLAPLILKGSFFAGDPSGFPFPGADNGRPYLIWLTCAVVVCVAMQIIFARRSVNQFQRGIYNFLAVYFAGFGFLVLRVLILHTVTWNGRVSWMFAATGAPDYWMLMGAIFAWVLPLALVVYAIVRYKALGIGSQKNLVYSVSIAFLAVLYLSVVRRVSGWMEPYFPPEATAGFLLFLLLAFFEPLQRLASRLLRRGFQEQVDRLQRLSAKLQREALRGESGRLIEFAEEHIRQEFGLESVRIHLNSADANRGRPTDEMSHADKKSRPAWAGQPVRLRLGKPGAEMGELEVVPVGSSISGEASAALDFLAEQLPAVIELCRAIEQKVALERELDERERMALVGQMTASISHNLKNPLGSMKTILQVQLENTELPAALRADLAMVLGELDRLSAKLNQLLQFARPAVRALTGAQNRIDVSAVAEQATSLLRHEAERRHGRLVFTDDSNGALVAGPEEALADIFSNLIVNAIEAMPDGGQVLVLLACENDRLVLAITDDGPGVSEENRTKLFHPFFTTKPSGTGLGLAIVERRAAELGGEVSCESPVVNGRGARFVVRLPITDGQTNDGKEG